ncbi:BZ3500_MvSof-1268-A1-R1_Chr1-3g02081 [Microbotryum saponariae]|uniref:BZ3500_MvSof-1268-A1-R1_Chr1-3g02081 protein n=1 Tax=Microbotryum saponariae TaxID=289078 RepID=A0A2X0MGH7_9BASI|nr:BZ3500_MvSof-1268-A1-R1_Chr1-3g02081 [Microbotryum saponariae]SCZ95362.1 BZ3501_MvSof-1269-A2-R1_Chr1-3g01683 [Microbotryum saponariae]
MDGPIPVHGATASLSASTTPTARALDQDDEARRSDTMGVSNTITREEPRRFAPLPKRQRLQRVQSSRDEDGDHTLSTSTARSAPPRTMTMTTTGKTRAASVPSSKSASTLIKPQDLEVEDEQWDEHVETNRMMEQSSLTTRNQEAHQALLEYRSNDHEHGEDDQGRTSNHPTSSRKPPLVSSLSKFSVTSSSSSSDGYRLGESTSSGQTFRGNTSSSPRLGSAEGYDEAADLDDRRVVSSSSNSPSTVVTSPVSTASSQARRHGAGDKSAGVSNEFSHDPRYAKAFSPELEADEEDVDFSAESLFGQVGRDVLRLLRTSMQSLVLSIPHNAELVLDDTDIGRRVDPSTDEGSCLRPNRQSSEERVPEADEDESYLHLQPSTRQGLSTTMPTSDDAPTLARYDSPSPIESQYESSNGDGRMTKKRKNPLGSISIGEEEEDEEREREDGSTREVMGAEGLTRYESAGGTRGKSRLGKVSMKENDFNNIIGPDLLPALFDRTLVPANPPTTAKAALAKLRHLPPRLSRDFWTLGRRRREIMGDQNHHPPLELPPVPIFTPPVVPRRSAPPPLKPGSGLKGSKAIKAAAKAEKERLKEQQRINALLGGSKFRLINLWDPLGLEESAAAIERARRKALANALQESGEKRAEVPTLEAFDVDGKTPPSIVKRYRVLNAAKDRLRVAELNAAKAREEENLRRLQKEKEELVREVEGSEAAAAAGADAVVDPLPTTPSAPPSASVPTAPPSPKATRSTKTRPSSPSATRSWSAQPPPPSAAPAAGKPSTATTVMPLSADRTNLPITSPTTYTTEPPSAIPPSTRKPRKKGKKKRSAHANALNPHHLNNYTPSRMPNRSSSGAAGSSSPHTDAPPSLLSILDDEVQPLSSWPASDQVISQALLTIRNRSAGDALRFFAGPEEDVCAFCDYELWFGGEGNLERSVRRRKKVLKVRKKAKERARKAANGKVAAATTTTTTTTMEDQGGERVESGSDGREVVDAVE